MSLKVKLFAAFMAMVVIVAIIGGIALTKFNSMSDNVDEIVDLNAPAAEIIMDMRIQLGWLFASHAELVEGADAYKSALAAGKTEAEAAAIADPIYISAAAAMNGPHDVLEEAHSEFNSLGYFTGADYDRVNALIETHDETIEYWRQLERDYRAANWEAGEATMELLDASAVEADAAMEQVEEEIDSHFVALNADTKDMATSSQTMILVCLLVGIAAAIALSYILTTVIVGPIKKLTDAANEIGEGNVEKTLPQVPNDEIGEMAEAIATMQGAIKFMKKQSEQQKSQEFEEKVAESL